MESPRIVIVLELLLVVIVWVTVFELPVMSSVLVMLLPLIVEVTVFRLPAIVIVLVTDVHAVVLLPQLNVIWFVSPVTVFVIVLLLPITL